MSDTIISFHGVKGILASCPGTIGGPVTLDLFGGDADVSLASITLFVDDPDRAERLAAAINEAVGNVS